MRASLTLMAGLLATVPMLAHAATSSTFDVSRSARLDLTLDRSTQSFESSRGGSAPTFEGQQIHYVSHASGLDRIDPADFKLLGGQIGGNGVQGGAVVSLSWPTQR